MNFAEQLKEEHEAIKLALQIMEQVCRKLDAGKPVSPEHLDGILEFIKVFADRCHHGKEEDLLFPAMEAAGIPREGGPIGIMLMEHDTGRGYVRGMAKGAAGLKDNQAGAAARFSENARNYISLLTQHIDKENDILYPMAEMHLSKEKQSQLLREFERVELERVGRGKHEEFHKFLEKMKGLYLSQ